MNLLAGLLLIGSLGMTLGSCKKRGPMPAASDGEQSVSQLWSSDQLQNTEQMAMRYQTAQPFRRIGVRWDADRLTPIEIATSEDGILFSDFIPVKIIYHDVEEMMLINGEAIAHMNGARYFKLRLPPQTKIQNLMLEFLEDEQPEDTRDEATNITPRLDFKSAEIYGLPVVSRSNWGAVAAQCSDGVLKQTKTLMHRLPVPGGDAVSTAVRLRQLQNYQMEIKGWCDIGYHYVIGQDGQIYEGRPLRERGSHVSALNSQFLGIALHEPPANTPLLGSMQHSLARLLEYLRDQKQATLSTENVLVHSDIVPSECPGEAVSKSIPRVLELAQTNTAKLPTITAPILIGIIYAEGTTSKRIANAKIKLSNGMKTTTDHDGFFRFKNIPPGNYTVSVEAASHLKGSKEVKVSSQETWASMEVK